MSRNIGTFNFAANLEVLAKSPLDAKQLVGTYSDLISGSTWCQADGNIWLYDGAIVAVASDSTSSNNGIYWLCDADNYNLACNWIKSDKGGSNGLSISSTDIILGGDLTENTTINGTGVYNINLTNLNNFQITPSGSSTVVFGIDSSGLLFSFSGGSITYDDNGGLKYGSNYSGNANFGDRSLVDKYYVDSVALGLTLHASVLAATTTNIGLSGLTAIDGYTPSNGDRILVKDQTNGADNGIYVASASTWTRASDYNFSPSGEVSNGDLIPVESGNTQSNSLWALTTSNPISSGDTLVFTLFGRPNQYTSGIGIDISVNTINVDGATLVGNSLIWTGNTFNVDPTSGTLSTALNNKLNVSIFNDYTGTTAPILNSVLTGATNGLSINNKNVELGGNLSKETIISGNSFNLCFGNSGSSINQFAVCAANINFNTSCFTPTATECVRISNGIFVFELSGSTGIITPLVNNSITGATNGICKYDNNNICLGGAISTTFDASGGNVLIQSTLSNINIEDSCVFFNTCGNIVKTDSNSVLITSSDASLSLSGATTIFTSTNETGIQYAANYSSGFTNCSLVDKEYVDNVITGNSNISAVYNQISTAVYSATTASNYIGAYSGSTIYLPNSPICGEKLSVADITGNALNSNILICSNTCAIIGSQSVCINTNYGSLSLIFNGIFWSAIGFIN